MPEPETLKAPLIGSCRLMVVLCSFMLIVNIVLARVSFNYNYLCMSYDPLASSSDKVNMTKYNAGHGVGTFKWDKMITGLLLGSYFWGYLASCILGGFCSDLWGSRRPFVWGNAVAAILLIFEIPSAYANVYVLFVCRLLQGFFTGISFAPVYSLFAQWLHPSERILLVGITFSGFPLGTVVTFPMTSLLCRYGFRGWESNFYVPGIIGLVNQIMFCRYIYDNPSLHPRISDREKEYLSSSMSFERPSSIPCFRLCTSLPVVAYFVSQTAQVWNWQTMVLNMPTYYKEVFALEETKNAVASSIPFFTLLVFRIFIALTFTRFYKCTGLSLTRFRKNNHLIGTIIPSLGIISLTFLNTTQYVLAIILLVIDQTVVDFAISGGFLASLLDIAPQYAGFISGISTTVSFSSSIISPLLTSYFTRQKRLEGWKKVYYVQAGILLFSCVFYELFGSSERLKWLAPPPDAVTPITQVNEDGGSPVLSLVSFDVSHTPMLSVPSLYGVDSHRWLPSSENDSQKSDHSRLSARSQQQ